MCVSLTSLDARIGRSATTKPVSSDTNSTKTRTRGSRPGSIRSPVDWAATSARAAQGAISAPRDASDRRQHEAFGEQLPLQA